MDGIIPIVAGAKYEDAHGEPVRVKSVWVDEDYTTQVQIFHESKILQKTNTKTVDIDTFALRIGDELERVNTDHEAWEWRNQ